MLLVIAVSVGSRATPKHACCSELGSRETEPNCAHLRLMGTSGSCKVKSEPVQLMCDLNGSVAKTIGGPNGSGVVVAANQTVLRPRVSLMNRTSPTTSPFGNQLTWPFRIMCTTS